VVSFAGFGRTVTGAVAMIGLGLLGLASAGLWPGPAPAVVAVAEAVVSYGVIVYNVSLFSLWQTTTPSGLRGRVSASLHFIIWGALPFGALAGGALGTFLSLRWAIGIGAAGVLVSAVWIALSVIGAVDRDGAATMEAE
jgi:hypothetical protein